MTNMTPERIQAINVFIECMNHLIAVHADESSSLGIMTRNVKYSLDIIAEYQDEIERLKREVNTFYQNSCGVGIDPPYPEVWEDKQDG